MRRTRQKAKPLASMVSVSVILASGLLCIGCARGVVGGKPTLTLAGPSGTSLVLDGTEAEVGAAITNAFDSLSYHDMLFVAVDPSIGATLALGQVVTNGFELLHGLKAASTVPLDNGRSLPYDADFYITVRATSSNLTTITVRTTRATVRDGQDPGAHGGWAIHQRVVAPVQREEDNVVAAISEQLKQTR